MANKEADRKAEALLKKIQINAGVGEASENYMGYVELDINSTYPARLKSALNETYAKAAALDKIVRSQSYGKADKGHLYVNGKHKLSTDMSKIHTVAETYMRQGDSVWISRKAIGL